RPRIPGADDVFRQGLQDVIDGGLGNQFPFFTALVVDGGEVFPTAKAVVQHIHPRPEDVFGDRFVAGQFEAPVVGGRRDDRDAGVDPVYEGDGTDVRVVIRGV